MDANKGLMTETQLTLATEVADTLSTRASIVKSTLILNKGTKLSQSLTSDVMRETQTVEVIRNLHRPTGMVT